MGSWGGLPTRLAADRGVAGSGRRSPNPPDTITLPDSGLSVENSGNSEVGVEVDNMIV